MCLNIFQSSKLKITSDGQVLVIFFAIYNLKGLSSAALNYLAFVIKYVAPPTGTY